MKSSTEHKIKDAIVEVKGGAKEKAGQVGANFQLEADGKSQKRVLVQSLLKLAGKIQKKIGQIERGLETNSSTCLLRQRTANIATETEECCRFD